MKTHLSCALTKHLRKIIDNGNIELGLAWANEYLDTDPDLVWALHTYVDRKLLPNKISNQLIKKLKSGHTLKSLERLELKVSSKQIRRFRPPSSNRLVARIKIS